MARAPTIERSPETLTVTMRTHRSGDMVHYVFGTLTTGVAVLVLTITIGNGTLFDSLATIPLVLAGFGYGWFAATRLLNRRVLTLGPDRMVVRDGPLLSLASSLNVPLGSIGKVTTREQRRWVPPLQWYRVSHVEAAGAPAVLFCAIDAGDAVRIRAALVAFLAAR